MSNTLIMIIAIAQIVMALVSIFHLFDRHQMKVLKVNFENAHDDMKMYRKKYEELVEELK